MVLFSFANGDQIIPTLRLFLFSLACVRSRGRQSDFKAKLL
jgi:hypothetical protein